MVTLCTGTPGSGKSLHIARKIAEVSRMHKMTVICNRPINMDVVSKNGKKKVGEFIYKTNVELTVDYLIDYAFKNHKAGVEGQTLVVIDEAGRLFNCREFGSWDRGAWLDFFALHRYYGYDFLMSSQHDRQIDRQIRYMIEYETKFKKANNFKFIGFLFTLCRVKLFVGVKKWYGENLRIGSEMFIYRKRDGKLYDTMMLFTKEHYGKRIGDTYNNASADTRATSPEPHPGDGVVASLRAGDPSPGCVTSDIRYLCHTKDCLKCRNELICKMPWKYKPVKYKTV